jgi:NAD(P)-dependent dehydrogenase (short-subunit alcohol dehydrogenase family)
MNLEGQVAIVTGASRGLGRHIALALARKRLRVVLAARSDGVHRVAEEIGSDVLAVTMNVARREDVERAVAAALERFGRIDIAVNNAGVGWYKPFEEWSLDEIDQTIDVNLKGTIYVTRCVLPSMLAAGYGQIVNIASDLGRRVLPKMAPYVASKFGVVGFAGSLLREVKGRGVRVMTLTPGIVDTYFAGGTEGSRDQAWSLTPQFVADLVVQMLEMPRGWVLDEISVHALGQDF